MHCLALMQTKPSSFLKSAFQVAKEKLALSKITLFQVVQIIQQAVITIFLAFFILGCLARYSITFISTVI
jgi:hypothetical protein